MSGEVVRHVVGVKLVDAVAALPGHPAPDTGASSRNACIAQPPPLG